MFRLSILATLGRAFDTGNEQTSLLQGMSPKTNDRRHEPVANLLAVAGNLLKNGATPDVVEFSQATLTEITGIVVPAIENASATDQTLLDRMFRQFELALQDLEEGTAIINSLNMEERAHSSAHKECRLQEEQKCTAKVTCDYELYDLWNVFKGEETDLRSIQDRIDGHFCIPGTNGTLQTFRDASVPMMEAFNRQYPEVVVAAGNYHPKLPVCQNHFTDLDDKTAECDAEQTHLESAACAHAVEVRRVRVQFAIAWQAAFEAYEATMEEVHYLQIDRIEEFKTLSVVQCLLDRTTERNGRPCDEASNESVIEITHCEEVRHTVDIEWLILTYHEVPPQPPACVDRDSVHGRCIPQPPPFPCTGGFVTQEYDELPDVPQPEFHSQNSHCNQRPDCHPCVEMQEPEPGLPSQSDMARVRCRRVMRMAPNSIGEAMFGIHRQPNDVNVCNDFEVTELRQSDFAEGTYIIRTPGIYRIQENIVMHPELENMMPTKDCENYPLEDGYWLGFVAGIAVASDNVFLDLNDKSISMSQEFLMRQRFFSVIQLGERPFKAATGPPQFTHMGGDPFFASNVVISDGQLGVSSHMGIHGVENSNIWINHVHIRDFETGGIQINGARDIHITNTEIGPSLGHANSVARVPGLATLSQALLLLRIVDGEFVENADVAFSNLRASVERYIAQMLAGTGIAEAESVFANPDGVPDGSSLYGIVLHAAKPAIHDFASCPQFDGEEDGNSFGPASLKDVIVRDLLLKTDEVVSMQSGNPGAAVMGPAGDVLQVFRIRDDDGNYVGNVLSEAQLALGRLKLAHTGESADQIFRLFGATNIPAEFVAWSQGEMTWDSMLSAVNGRFVCMKDAMTHHNKGVMGVRVEYYHDVSFDDVRIENFENVGRASEISHCTGDDYEYAGNDARGLTFSHVSGIAVEGITIHGMNSPRGFAYGVEERVQVAYEGTPHYDIDNVHGEMGSVARDDGTTGMLDSDA